MMNVITSLSPSFHRRAGLEPWKRTVLRNASITVTGSSDFELGSKSFERSRLMEASGSVTYGGLRIMLLCALDLINKSAVIWC